MIALRDKVMDRLSNKSFRVILTGPNPVALELIATLNGMGVGNALTAVFDWSGVHAIKYIHAIPVVDSTAIGTVEVDLLVVTEDETKESALAAFAAASKRIPEVIVAGAKHFAFKHTVFEKIVATAPVRSIAGGYPLMLTHIAQSLEHLVKANRQGAVVEFGVFQGGTLAIMARFLRELGWKGRIIGFDLFGLPGKRRSVYDVFQLNRYASSFETVRRYCEPYGVELIQGDIVETYRSIEGLPLMFTLFDTDFYSPTCAALPMCYEQTAQGGIIAFDHYHSEKWTDTVGERVAADEMLRGKNLFHLHGTGMFVKT